MRLKTEAQRLIARAAKRCDRLRIWLAEILGDARLRREDDSSLEALRNGEHDYRNASTLLVSLLPEEQRESALW